MDKKTLPEKEKLQFPVCSCSFKQPTDKGFDVYEKGQGYDIDGTKFHPDTKQDHDIREGIRAAYFKKSAIKINKSEKQGGNSK